MGKRETEKFLEVTERCIWRYRESTRGDRDIYRETESETKRDREETGRAGWRQRETETARWRLRETETRVSQRERAG